MQPIFLKSSLYSDGTRVPLPAQSAVGRSRPPVPHTHYGRIQVRRCSPLVQTSLLLSPVHVKLNGDVASRKAPQSEPVHVSNR